MPSLVTFVQLPGTVQDVVIAGNHAYVTARSFGVHVVDISTPAQSTYIGTLPLPTGTETIDVEGGFIYIGGQFSTDGVYVLRAFQTAVP